MAKKQDVSIAVIEEKVSKLEKWVNVADTNHFPTITKQFNSVEKRFDRIEKRIAYFSGAIVVITWLLEKFL